MHPAGTEAADMVDMGVAGIRVAGVMAAAAVGTADIEQPREDTPRRPSAAINEEQGVPGWCQCLMVEAR